MDWKERVKSLAKLNAHPPVVISISGNAGSGKTTVAHALINRLSNAAMVAFDDYPSDLLGQDYCQWSENGANANAWNLECIEKDLNGLLQKSYDYIILDYPFGYAHQSIAKYIDFAVWIDTPLDISLARRVLRDITQRSETRRPLKGTIAEQVTTYLNFYLSRHRDTYFRHTETVRPMADFVVDGTMPSEIVMLEIINFMSKSQM